MVNPVFYDREDELGSLRNFLFTLSKSVETIFLETNFYRVYEAANLSSWELFKTALNETSKNFQRAVHEYPFSHEKLLDTGFSGTSLELKINTWNSLAFEAQETQKRRGFIGRFPRLEGILDFLLEFINIILGSASQLGLPDALDEVKQLGEFSIKKWRSLPSPWAIG